MAIFEPTRLTRKGRELMNKVYTGTPLSICGVVVGDGYLDEGETALDITELKNRLEAVECGIISNETVSSAESMITVRVKSGAQIFTLREIGILAANPEGGDPILYAYTNAGDYPDFIPSTRTSSRINRDYGIITAVGDAENLVIENISFAEVSREEFESHTHAELHTHDNKGVLDSITQGDVDNWNTAAGDGMVVADGSVTAAKLATAVKAELDKAHTHGNKSVLDDISNDDPSNWSEAYDKRHTHSNKSVLDSITSTLVKLWNSAYDAMHSHSNKSTLDEISSTDTSNWKTAASDIAAHIINKSNPHKVTKSQVGLSNVTNVAQASKAEFNALKDRVNNEFDNLYADKLDVNFQSNGYVGMDEVTSKIDELENTSIKRITDKNTEISSRGGMYYVMKSAASNMPVSTDAFLVMAFDAHDTTVNGNSTWGFIATDLYTGKRYRGSGDDTSNAQAFNTSIRWTEI